MLFCNFINRIQDRADKDPCAELLDELLRAINYETWLYDRMIRARPRANGRTSRNSSHG